MFATVAGAARCGKTLRRLVRRSSKSEGGRNPCLHRPHHGLLRGACHRARVRATRWLAMTMWRQWARQINPTGKSKNPSGPLAKNIPLNPSGKSAALIRASHGRRGAARDRHERAVGCGGREACARRAHMTRTAKSCGPDAAVLASSRAGSFLRGDGGKRAVHRGEHAISRKATAQGRPECFR